MSGQKYRFERASVNCFTPTSSITHVAVARVGFFSENEMSRSQSPLIGSSTILIPFTSGAKTSVNWLSSSSFTWPSAITPSSSGFGLFSFAASFFFFSFAAAPSAPHAALGLGTLHSSQRMSG